MTSMRRKLSAVGYAGLFAVAGAQAQNLIQNPYFDDHLTGWLYDPPGQVTWSPSVDYPAENSGITGSMKLDGARTPSLALQCVQIQQSFDYVASMRVNSHCTGQALHVFWTDSSCTAGSSFASATSTHADQWDLVTLLSHPAVGAQWAIVVVENPGGSCTDPAFVDDVVFATDIIFANGFEPPTPP